MGTRAFWRAVDSAPPFESGPGSRDIFSQNTSPPPGAPDYTAMQTAADQAAATGNTLGDQQIAEAQRQYGLSRGVTDQVTQSQLALMDQAKAQGNDYYNYMLQNQRPLQARLSSQALADTSGQDAATRAAIQARYDRAAQDASGVQGQMVGLSAANDQANTAQRAQVLSLMQQGYSQADAVRAIMASRAGANDQANMQERALLAGGDTGIYNARRGDIEEGVGRAVADARAGQAASTGQIIRQALRYGYSPAKLAALAGAQGLGQGSQQAAAANAARQQGIGAARGQLQQGYDLRNAGLEQFMRLSDADRTAILQNYAGQAGAVDANAVARNAAFAQRYGALGENRQMGLDQAQLGITGATNARTMSLQDQELARTRLMDAIAQYSPYAGYAQNAYGVSANAGNAAVANALQPGNQLLTGMAQGAGLKQAGAGQQLTGLNSILSAKQAYNNMLSQYTTEEARAKALSDAGWGSLAGTVAPYLFGGGGGTGAGGAGAGGGGIVGNFVNGATGTTGGVGGALGAGAKYLGTQVKGLFSGPSVTPGTGDIGTAYDAFADNNGGFGASGGYDTGADWYTTADNGGWENFSNGTGVGATDAGGLGAGAGAMNSSFSNPALWDAEMAVDAGAGAGSGAGWLSSGSSIGPFIPLAVAGALGAFDQGQAAKPLPDMSPGHLRDYWSQYTGNDPSKYEGQTMGEFNLSGQQLADARTGMGVFAAPPQWD